MKKGFKLVSVVLTVTLLMVSFVTPLTAAQEAKQSVSDRGKLVNEFDDGSKVTVMHASPGSVLLGFGGPDKYEENADEKADIVLQELGWVPMPVDLDNNTTRTFDFTESSAQFGNGFVRIRQQGNVVGTSGWIATITVGGVTETLWSGTTPQWNSDQIKLNESWTFHGISVSVSIPLGIGFSGSGNTVSWFAHDTSGAQWRMRHTYSDVRGSSSVALTGATKSGTGSHRFQGWQWISVSGSRGII